MTQSAPLDASPDTPTGPAARTPVQARRAAWAGFAGTFVEYYDFALYGVLTVFFAPQFFPAANPATSLLAGLAVFGAGFVSRPLGGILFGRIGDRYGRRPALVSTLVLMGLCSGLVGLLPTYASIGVWAPVLLVLLRLGQGISAGSELLGSVTFVLESAPKSKRIFLASMTPFGASLGTAAATASVWALSSSAGGDWMSDYGWRLLFLLGFPLTAVALWIRSGISESPEFKAESADGGPVKSPLRELFRKHRRVALLAGGVAIAANGTSGLIAWFSTYLVGTRDLPEGTVFAALAIGSLIAAPTVLVSGLLTERHGQLRVTSVILGALVLGALPFLWLLGTATELPALLGTLVVYNILGVCLMPPAYTLIAQLFPVSVRYTGATFGQNIGNVLGAGVAPFVGAQLAVGTGSALGPAIWIVGVAVVGLVALSAIRTSGASAPQERGPAARQDSRV
ncbi:MFS transporter [Streptomyces sp. NPDC091292]|uniref:MFS transporter n=1 Tax=Streptomyces sp. NPDC091292 TaxID=3365991 RepID=UPI00382984CD